MNFARKISCLASIALVSMIANGATIEASGCRGIGLGVNHSSKIERVALGGRYDFVSKDGFTDTLEIGYRAMVGDHPGETKEMDMQPGALVLIELKKSQIKNFTSDLAVIGELLAQNKVDLLIGCDSGTSQISLIKLTYRLKESVD